MTIYLNLFTDRFPRLDKEYGWVALDYTHKPGFYNVGDQKP